MQKKVPYVAQLGNMDCSIACMTMLFRYYGLDVDIVDVGQVVHIGRDGVNLTQLKQATQQFGFKCTAYRYNKQKNILDSNLPAVVYSGSHLAVIGSKTVLGQYILLDPIKGKSIVNFEQIHDTFSDILMASNFIAYALAFSIGLICSRWILASTMSMMAWSSSTSRTCTLILSSPASCAA